MKIAITGSSGFVGSALLQHLIEKNIVKKEDLILIQRTKKGSEYVEYTVEELIDNPVKVDILIHIAGGIDYKDKTSLFEDNVKLTNTLLFLTKLSFKKIIFFSTSMIYDMEKNIGNAYDEKSHIKPNSYYGVSKYISELLVERACTERKIPYIILRPAPTYGKGTTHGFIHHFIESAKTHKKITIFGDGEKKTRDVIHINDVVSAVIKSIDSYKTGAFNLCSGKSHSLMKIAQIIQKNIPGTIIEEQKTDTDNNPTDSIKLSNEKIIKELDWKPSVELEQGIIETISSN